MTGPKIAMAAHSRTIDSSRPFSFRRFFLQWEWMLMIIFILINVFNAVRSPNYLVFDNIMNNLQGLFDKAILVFPMMMVILLGQIDISIASTMALSATVMGVAYESGMPMGMAMIVCLVAGAACGLFNGVIIAKFPELSSMIVTLSTMIIFRGIASIILEDGAVTGFPRWFQFLAWGRVGNLSFIILFFFVLAAIFAYVIHFTRFGRNLYAMGNNETAAKYSGIQTARYKIIVFTIMGLFAGIAALFLASKMSSVRPNIALGYELDVIAMVVLGGVINTGGKGRVIGVVISAVMLSLLRFGLGITNVPAQILLIIIGALLIIAVAIPNIKQSFKR